VALIFAGALGNLLDSMFYGLIFNESTYTQVANIFPPKGYAGFLHGKVVDMLYFPIIQSHYPSWFPVVGGNEFEFFSPVFNIADASISVGVIAILIFQKKFFKHSDVQRHSPVVETNTKIDDNIGVL
jgi:signal peptidase II